jgi:diguanylate cyclase (GGDEF)-like protein
MAAILRMLRARTRAASERLGLLGRFSVLSFVCLAALGVGLAHFMGSRIQSRAVNSATQEAELVAKFGIAPQVIGADLNQKLAPEATAALDSLLHSGYSSQQVREIRVWNAHRRVVYSNNHAVIGNVDRTDEELQTALRGRTSAHVAPDFGGTVEVYVPLRYGGDDGAPTAGAFEVYLDYAPVAAVIRADSHRAFVLIGIGLLITWALLFRIVAGASRRLRRQAAENEHQAHHDGLTGLPNRGSFYERVAGALTAARPSGSMTAVMIVDLDRFKEVNDTLGHHSGDELLIEAGRRLSVALREGDVLSRLGGDEFAVLLPHVESLEAACAVADRLCEALEEPFVLHGLTVHLEASVGLALHPEHGDDVEILMQRADVAMYVAKRSTSSHEVYATRYDRHSASRLALLGELRHAIDGDEFVLHYQPKASLSTGQVNGVEALVRWDHPKRGIVPPDEFIPLAEQTGVIKPLTAWVLDNALAQCRIWRDSGLDLTVAVNLSVRNLLDAHLPESIGELLRRYELPPSALELEITESTIVADQVRALDVLTRLNAMGIGLSVDDFGTGYSSLAYLKDLPVCELKIDRKFVNNMTEDGDDAFIVRSTIDLGRNLGLQVVAEGVETEAVWDQLALLGCDVAQGYYLARPLPAADLTSWLQERRRDSVGSA